MSVVTVARARGEEMQKGKEKKKKSSILLFTPRTRATVTTLYSEMTTLTTGTRSGRMPASIIEETMNN